MYVCVCVHVWLFVQKIFAHTFWPFKAISRQIAPATNNTALVPIFNAIVLSICDNNTTTTNRSSSNSSNMAIIWIFFRLLRIHWRWWWLPKLFACISSSCLWLSCIWLKLLVSNQASWIGLLIYHYYFFLWMNFISSSTFTKHICRLKKKERKKICRVIQCWIEGIELLYIL